MNTRRYHGLLVAATKPPVGRMVLLSKLEETIVTRRRAATSFPPTAIPGAIHPRGLPLPSGVPSGSVPRLRRTKSAGTGSRSACSWLHGENTTVVRYTLLAGPRCTLELRPLIAFRDYHSLTHHNDALNPDSDRSARGRDACSHTAACRGSTSPTTPGHSSDGGDWYLQLRISNGEGAWTRLSGGSVQSFRAATFDLRRERHRGRDRVDRAARSMRSPIALREARNRAAPACAGAAADPTIRSSRALTRGGSVPRATRRPKDRHRGLSLVQRLGPGHDDRAARA